MHNCSDSELLRDYVRHKSETAFGELVRRYAALVYSAAFRQTGSPEKARDVAQVVFADLARKAGSLPSQTMLAGWLYRAVRFEALELRRSEQRRQVREIQAMQSIDPSPEPNGDWGAVRPILDEAMATLDDRDRDALLLRFFKNESLSQNRGRLGSERRRRAKARLARLEQTPRPLRAAGHPHHRRRPLRDPDRRGD